MYIETIDESTLREVERMLNSGMEQVSRAEYIHRLDQLGYKIASNAMSFRYTNLSNDIHYKCYSIYIQEKDTGMSAFHYQARRDDKFKALQAFKMDVFAFSLGVGYNF